MYHASRCIHSVLQTNRAHRANKSHDHLATLRVGVLFNCNVYCDLVEHADCCRASSRLGNVNEVVFWVELVGVLCKCDEAFKSKADVRLNTIENSRGDKYGETITERANDKCLFADCADLLHFGASLECEADVELNGSTACHLGKAMSLVHIVEDALNVLLGLPGRMQWGVVDCSGQLSMNQNIGVSANGRCKVGVDVCRKTIMPV